MSKRYEIHDGARWVPLEGRPNAELAGLLSRWQTVNADCDEYDDTWYPSGGEGSYALREVDND